MVRCIVWVGSDVRTVPEFKLHPIVIWLFLLLCSSDIIINERLGQKQLE